MVWYVVIQFMFAVIMARVKNATKEWMWKRIWNGVDGDSVYSVWKNEDDDSTVILFDPKAVFTDQIQDTTSEFTMYHFIAHMENMRMKLPEEDFINHKEWVFNKYPNKVPTFRQLLRGLLNCLLTCVARSFLR